MTRSLALLPVKPVTARLVWDMSQIRDRPV